MGHFAPLLYAPVNVLQLDHVPLPLILIFKVDEEEGGRANCTQISACMGILNKMNQLVKGKSPEEVVPLTLQNPKVKISSTLPSHAPLENLSAREYYNVEYCTQSLQYEPL